MIVIIQSAISELEELLTAIPAAFLRLTAEEVTSPRQAGKWSRLQLLGHLCDSAINNLSRFIKVQYEPQPLTLAVYNQDEWMAVQQYAGAPPEEILTLWITLNQSILRVFSRLTPSQLSLIFQIEGGETVTLEWLIEDYLVHMKHHLGQIFPDQKFT